MTITDKTFKVVIPTAGTGSRLNNLTKHLNKSLIGLENKPVLSRIIDMFPTGTEFVIALGYKGDIVKQYIECAYPEGKFEFATVDKYEGEGSGLGLTLLACEKFLHRPFVFCSCDTLVKEKIPYPDKNIAAYSINENDISQYRTLAVKDGKVTKVCEKAEPEETSKPYIGLACISDWELFWQFMHEGKDEAVKIGESYALKEFAKKGILNAAEFTWSDTGNPEKLKVAQQYFKEENSPNILQKPDEAIWFIDDKVIKFSADENFIKDRVKRSKLLTGYVPEIIASKPNMYVYKKANGTVLSKIKDLETFKKLLDFSKEFWQSVNLDVTQKKEFYDTCKKFYKDKTISRINLYYETFNQSDKELTVNGELLPKTSDILNTVDWEEMFEGLPGRFHGDFHFENILFDEKTGKFTFLDWRQNFGNSLSVGDIYYDFAKLLHGLIICHELIAKNRFSVELSDNSAKYDFERKAILTEVENYFYDWLANEGHNVKKVKILTALIYLNIAALHHYPYCHLLYLLGKKMLFDNVTS